MTNTAQPLQSAFKALNDIQTHAEQKISFIRKQADTINKEAKEQAIKVWDEVTQYCSDNKLLPDEFKKETHHFHFDETGGVLYVCDPSEHERKKHPLQRIIEGMKNGEEVILGPFESD